MRKGYERNLWTRCPVLIVTPVHIVYNFTFESATRGERGGYNSDNKDAIFGVCRGPGEFFAARCSFEPGGRSERENGSRAAMLSPTVCEALHKWAAAHHLSAASGASLVLRFPHAVGFYCFHYGFHRFVVRYA